MVDEASEQSIVCPYHAWTYGLDGSLRAAPGFRENESFVPAEQGLVELPVEVWQGWVFVNATGTPRRSPSTWARWPTWWTPYAAGASCVVAGRHTYEIAANWKVDRRELPRVLPLPAHPS